MTDKVKRLVQLRVPWFDWVKADKSVRQDFICANVLSVITNLPLTVLKIVIYQAG